MGCGGTGHRPPPPRANQDHGAIGAHGGAWTPTGGPGGGLRLAHGVAGLDTAPRHRWADTALGRPGDLLAADIQLAIQLAIPLAIHLVKRIERVNCIFAVAVIVAVSVSPFAPIRLLHWLELPGTLQIAAVLSVLQRAFLA